MGHALMESDNGLLMDFVVSSATGGVEREVVPAFRPPQEPRRPHESGASDRQNPFFRSLLGRQQCSV